jgi:hypothetical protein
MSKYALLILCLAHAALTASETRPVYTAAQAKHISAAALLPLLPRAPKGLGRPISDRVWWNKVAAATGDSHLKYLGKLSAAYQPDFTDKAWLTPTRYDPYHKSLSKGTELLNRLTAAECIANRGDYLPRIIELVDALSAIKTWVPKCHDRKHVVFSGKGMYAELLATRLGYVLAVADYLLGDKLPKTSRQRIRQAVGNRLFAPYIAGIETGKPGVGMSWIRSQNNWNPVCHSNVIGAAAILIDSPQERARLMAFAIRNVQSYLRGFGNDGYCQEGIGYFWYGFSHYLFLAENLLHLTNGGVNLYQGTEKLKNIELFPASLDMGSTLFPAFGDCPLLANYRRKFIALKSVALIDVRCGYNAYVDNWHDEYKVPGKVTDLILTFDAVSNYQRPKSAAHDNLNLTSYFRDAGIVVSRAAERDTSTFSLALKAGDNGSYHNHNDIGSFTIGLNGVPIIADPGLPVYTPDSFTAKRYENTLCNSYGHPVPVVDGSLQGSCDRWVKSKMRYQGTITKTDFSRDRTLVQLDLAKAYPAGCGIVALTRTFIHDRPNQRITIQDEVVFDKPRKFGAALVTFETIRNSTSGSYLIGEAENALRVSIASGDGRLQFTQAQLKDKAKFPRQPVRIGYDFSEPVLKGSVTAVITPQRQE